MSGFYILRDADGKIVGAFRQPQPDASEEFLPEGDAELIEFFERPNRMTSVISDRQFFQGLAAMGIITEAEALEAVGPGTIPAAMDALIEQLPEDARFAARMKLRGATQFIRNDPLSETMRQLYGWTPEQTDAFWAMAGGL